MNRLVRGLCLWVAMTMVLSACHEVEEWENDPRGNFDALWTVLDAHYCFFEEKGVDWDSVYARYSVRIDDEMTSAQLFEVCAEMLAELEDGHVNLSSASQTSYYRKWWSDYPQNYDERLWQEHYFNFNYLTSGGINYGILPENIGYMQYGSFSNNIGEGNLDAVLAYFATCQGLIIDVRDNSGGNLTNVETLVARFISERQRAGYISHKTGPGHGDFSEPEPFYYDPAEPGRIAWLKPVVVLTNRGTFSAANNFVAIMKTLPNVKIVGDVTGGGGGMPFNSELPNGWSIRFSACPILDPNGATTETGVSPSEGCKVDLDRQAALQGHDTIIDFAVALLKK